MAEEPSIKYYGKRCFVIISYILFGFNVWKFLNNHEVNAPIHSIFLIW